jgi:Insertion element 4 transposase N-terminal/Transposase DDE domain
MARTVAGLPKGTRVSDLVTLGVLTTTVPASLIDAVLADTERGSIRQRALPARLVVYYVMALALYAQASYGEVLRCLLEGVRWLRLGGAELALATKSAITKARRRLGPAPLAELYRRVARPLAEPGLPGCFYRGHRLVSLDGTTLDLPDTPDLESRFGRPSASHGKSAFPQIRLLALAETGTHAVFAAAFDRYATAETTLARRLVDRLQPGMLCLADRAFVGFALWRQATATGADLLWRLRANQVLPCVKTLPDGSYLSRLHASPDRRRRDGGGVTVRVIDYRLDGVPGADPLYRLVTTLLDPDAAPAGELAALYHERWEAEGIFCEIKVTLPGRRLMLRSRRADLAEQEVYGLLLVHFALRHLMRRPAGRRTRIPTRCPSSTPSASSAAICRGMRPFPPRRRQQMLALVLIEIAGLPAERSRGRHKPRVVKRKMSDFPTRSRAEPAPSGRLKYEERVRIVPPAVAETDPAASAPSRSRGRAKPGTPNRDRLQHVRNWRAGGMSRADYCRRHGLNPKAFNHWIARSRYRRRRKASKAAMKP